MITLILAEMPDGGVFCTVKAKGLIVIDPQRAKNWIEALEWAAALVDESTDALPSKQKPPEVKDGDT